MLRESYFSGKESHLIRESQVGHPCFRTSRRLRLTALKRCDRIYWSGAAIRMRSWLCASDSCQLSHFVLRCTAPVCSCSAAATDATGNRSSLILRADLHRAYTNRRHPPGTLFPIYLWNFHIDTPFGVPRTTNAVEAYGTAALTPLWAATTPAYGSSFLP